MLFLIFLNFMPFLLLNLLIKLDIFLHMLYITLCHFMCSKIDSHSFTTEKSNNIPLKFIIYLYYLNILKIINYKIFYINKFNLISNNNHVIKLNNICISYIFTLIPYVLPLKIALFSIIYILKAIDHSYKTM